MQRGRTAHDREHELRVIGREQFAEHCAVNFFFRAGERQIGEPRARDGDFFLREIVDDAVGRRHDIHAEGAQTVDDRGRPAARRGHHGDPMAPGGFLARDQRRQFEQGFEHVDAQHAVRAEIGVRHFVGARERAGVRGGKVLPDVGAAKLVNDHGFVGRVGAPRRIREAIGVAQRFKKQ